MKKKSIKPKVNHGSLSLKVKDEEKEGCLY